MNTTAMKWIKFVLRWGVAALGIGIVLAKTSFHDRVTILGPGNQLQTVQVADGISEDARSFAEAAPGTAVFARDELWTQPERSSVRIAGADGKPETVKLLGVHPQEHQLPNQPPRQLLIQDPKSSQTRLIEPSQVVEGYTVQVPHPLIDLGIFRLVRQANGLYLLIALMVLPLSYFITSRRWHMLLETVDIHVSQGRTFVLNMVGSFYNSFMPGSTGGDLIKAYYTAKQTKYRTRAVMSVIIDRILGLLALIILGGVMAAFQYQIATCRYVAIGSGLILLGTVVGSYLLMHPPLRRRSGLDWILRRLPMQGTVHRAIETMEIYFRRPWVVIAAIVMTLPVHMTTIVSATFAGKAFGLPLHAMYYWAIVPVITLVGAIPISPQGAGVMEYFAVELTRRQGVAVSQAFALVMAIRLCQMFWNLLAAVFVLRGGFHAPTQSEAQSLQKDDEPGGDDADRRAA